MKSYELIECGECPNNIVCHCYGFEEEREFTKDDEKEISINGFPSWCPLEDVKEGDDKK